MVKSLLKCNFWYFQINILRKIKQKLRHKKRKFPISKHIAFETNTYSRSRICETVRHSEVNVTHYYPPLLTTNAKVPQTFIKLYVVCLANYSHVRAVFYKITLMLLKTSYCMSLKLVAIHSSNVRFHSHCPSTFKN